MDVNKKPNLIDLIERIRMEQKLSKDNSDIKMLYERIKQNKQLIDYILSSMSLHDRYIISCRFKNDSTQYAMIDCGYPGWISELFMAKRFDSIDSAKEWFEDSKHYLMEEPYGNPNEIVDDSIKIQQIACIDVEDIKYDISESNTLYVIRAVSMALKKEVFATANITNPWVEDKELAITFNSIDSARNWLFSNPVINYQANLEPDIDQRVLASSLAIQDFVTGDNISVWDRFNDKNEWE